MLAGKLGMEWETWIKLNPGLAQKLERQLEAQRERIMAGTRLAALSEQEEEDLILDELESSDGK